MPGRIRELNFVESNSTESFLKNYRCFVLNNRDRAIRAKDANSFWLAIQILQAQQKGYFQKFPKSGEWQAELSQTTISRVEAEYCPPTRLEKRQIQGQAQKYQLPRKKINLDLL